MNPHVDNSDEIGVFDAARYFSGYEIHGNLSRKHSIVDSDTQCSLLKSLNLPKNESNLVHQKAYQKKTSEGNKPTSPRVRLSLLFNNFFHQSNSGRSNNQKQLESSIVPGTPKSYPLNPKRYKSLMHYSQCNDGFSAELWRDRRLDGIMVVGKRWVLNNYANDGGLCCKFLHGENGLSASKTKIEDEDDDGSSVASSDLFELENCK